MKVKTSITLSEETLRAVDKLAGKGSNRSRVIEQAIKSYLAARAQSERDRRELEALNRASERMNREMEDVLDLQELP